MRIAIARNLKDRQLQINTKEEKKKDRRRTKSRFFAIKLCDLISAMY
jgi:hypothetical protein